VNPLSTISSTALIKNRPTRFVPLMTFADVCACSAMLGGRSNERRTPKVGKPNGRAEVTHDPMRQVDIDRRLANLARAPRCGARTRAGRPCRQAAGKVPHARRGQRLGRPRGERNGNYKHGLWTLEEVQARATARARMRGIRAYLKGAVRGRT
jgi:hypothetical protein